MFEFSKLDPRLLKIHFQNSNYSFATELLTEVKKSVEVDQYQVAPKP